MVSKLRWCWKNNINGNVSLSYASGSIEILENPRTQRMNPGQVFGGNVIEKTVWYMITGPSP